MNYELFILIIVCENQFKIEKFLNPYPQTPFPRKGAILLGLPPLDPVGGFAPATPFNMLKRFIGIYCCAIKCTNFVFIAL